MDEVPAAVAAVIEATAEQHAFSGAVHVRTGDGSSIERAFGWADRRWRVPFTPSTRAAIASGTKGFTALTVMRLVEQGALSLTTTARSLLGDALPLVDDAVTIEHLLSHRSGIGDYLDEETLGDVSEHVLQVPAHLLDSTEAYVAVIDGHTQVSSPGTRFAYNNGGFVLLALLAERATGRRFEQLVDDLVCRPAGLTATGFVRYDALPTGVATGYLDGDGFRTNSLHLPVVGSGDGGIFTTVADVDRLWSAMFAGRIVSDRTVALVTTLHGEGHGGRYGFGFWLADEGPAVRLEGYDAGVSFRSWHDPTTGVTHTVIGNTSDGAWPMSRALRNLLGPPERAV